MNSELTAAFKRMRPHLPHQIQEAEKGDKGFDGEEERAHVVYSYVVNGTSLQSKRLGNGKWSSPAEIVKRYPVGKQVQVYYDPQNPKFALLERSGSGPTIILILAIMNLAIIIGGFMQGR